MEQAVFKGLERAKQYLVNRLTEADEEVAAAELQDWEPPNRRVTGFEYEDEMGSTYILMKHKIEDWAT